MATTTHTATSKPTRSPMTDAPEVLRAITETGTAQAKEVYGKVSAVTAKATDLIRTSCSTAVEGAQAYNDKLLAFAQANSKVAFDFAQQASRRDVAFRVHSSCQANMHASNSRF